MRILTRFLCFVVGHEDVEAHVVSTEMGDYLGVRCVYCKTPIPDTPEKPFLGFRPKGHTYWTLL